MQHWYTIYETQQARLREERDRAMQIEAVRRAAHEGLDQGRRTAASAGRAGIEDAAVPGRTARRWTIRLPRLAVTITVNPEVQR